MTRRHRTNPTRSRFTAALGVIVALLAIGLPASTTGANLTNTKEITSSTTPVGDWCSVPGSSQFKNVYKLSDFATIQAPEGTGSTAVRMLIVPVVNNGDFAPVGGSSTVPTAQIGQLGIRLWGCSDLSTATATVKATAWRGTYGTQPFTWDASPDTGTFSSARLNASGPLTSGATTTRTSPGAELRDLHRAKNTQGGTTSAGTNGVTMRYSWLLSNGRDKTQSKHQLSPTCSVATIACTVTAVTGGDGVAGLGNAFSTNETVAASGAVTGNSATYLASKYYTNGGTWPKTMATVSGVECQWWRLFSGGWTDWEFFERATCPPQSGWDSRSRPATRSTETDSTPSVTPTVLKAPTGMSKESILRDVSGEYVQWMVLEWWGGSNPPADVEIEVFVK